MNDIFSLFQISLIVLTAVLFLFNNVSTLIQSGEITLRPPDFRLKKVVIIDTLFWVSVLAWAAFGICWYLFPNFRSSLLPLTEIPIVSLQILGLFIGLLAQLYITLGFYALGKYFRTSINYHEKISLITHGIYKYGRNPMALGMILQGWAAFCLLQTWSAFLVALCLHLSNRLRVSNEESYLQNTLGDEYIKYCRNTNRFFDWPH